MSNRCQLCGGNGGGSGYGLGSLIARITSWRCPLTLQRCYLMPRFTHTLLVLVVSAIFWSLFFLFIYPGGAYCQTGQLH